MIIYNSVFPLAYQDIETKRFPVSHIHTARYSQIRFGTSFLSMVLKKRRLLYIMEPSAGFSLGRHCGEIW